MKPDDFFDHDDVGVAIREGRPLRQSREYRFLLAKNGVDFRTVRVADPVPLGRQILTAGGLPATSAFALVGILPNGDFEDINLDETFDLRGRGAERIIAFDTDCLYRLTLNGGEAKWGKPAISGHVLHKLANAPAGDVVTMRGPDGAETIVEADEVIDLRARGVEVFTTGPRPLTTIIVNARPRQVTGPTITFEQVVQIAFPGQHDASVRFSMTYRHAASVPHAGELGPGGVVKIREGTAFNVSRTVQS